MRYEGSIFADPDEYEKLEQLCRNPDASQPHCTAIFDKEYPFDNGFRMAVQVCTTTQPSEESCWTQGVLFDSAGNELATTDVGESFGGEYHIWYGGDEYVVNILRNDMAKERT